jgi:broad-specificity NMP kinase
MPYIPDYQRKQIDGKLNYAFDWVNQDVQSGLLNYIITRLLLKASPEPSYTRYNELIGVLECIKLELYRRLVAKYEDEKIEENGDLF